MVFGPAMPVLFKTAAASLFVLYCLEVFMLFFVYKKPPQFDVLLNNHVLKTLSWAPFTMLAFSFWYFTNPALLGNYTQMQAIRFMKDPFDNGHYWYNSLKSTSPAVLLGYLAICFFVFRHFGNIIMAFVGLVTNNGRNCCRGSLKGFWPDQVEIDEEIPEYDEVLTKTDRKYTLAEELNCRMFGIQGML